MRAWTQGIAAILLCIALAALPVLAQAPPAPAEAAPEAAAPEGPREVQVGVYINDIQAVDLRTHSYIIDLYVWFRWRPAGDFDPALSFEFMNRFDPQDRPISRPYGADALPQPDGYIYNYVRFQGPFSTKFPVRRYPFDDQQLEIIIEDANNSVRDLVYVSDGVTHNDDIRLPGYRVGAPRLAIDQQIYPTAFGDREDPDATTYSRATVRIPIQRPWVSGAVKTLFPVLLIMLCAAAALLLSPEHVEARIGLAITALLTLVALQFSMSDVLPDVGYLLMLDQIYIASYAFVLVIVALIVGGVRRFERRVARRDIAIARAELQSGAGAASLVVGLYFAAVLAIIYLNLRISDGV